MKTALYQVVLPHGMTPEALAIAVEAAQAAGSSGFRAEVLVQDGNRRPRLQWTYGVDVYPLTASESRRR